MLRIAHIGFRRLGLSLFLPVLVGLLFAITVSACDSNPVGTDTDNSRIAPEDLTVEFSLSSDHVHTLSEVDLTVEVTGPDGSAFTEFDSIAVERKMHEEETWRAIDLTRDGHHFTGAYTFMSSGEYEVRVVGRPAGRGEMAVLYEHSSHVEVARAHVEKDGYRIEYENFPGHVHEGQEAAVRFWVMEAEENASGERPPVENLEVEIHCTDPSGAEENHQAEEHDPGVYEAHHTLEDAGEAHFAVHVPTDGGEIEADFHVPVAHGH